MVTSFLSAGAMQVSAMRMTATVSVTGAKMPLTSSLLHPHVSSGQQLSNGQDSGH